MPGPFREPPFMDDGFDFRKLNNERVPAADPELFSAFMQDMKSHESSGEVAPDTRGADYFFLEAFVTDDMMWDFDRIEEDFMRHCYDKLREFGQIQCYEIAARYSSPEESHRSMVMGLILNGAKSGDAYCVALIKYLFKTYHKPLYKQLKRFSKISVEEVLAISESDNMPNFHNLSIVLTMCAIDNVVLSDHCSILYKWLEKRQNEIEEEQEESTEFMEFADNLFDECHLQVEEWVAEDEKNHPSFRNQIKTYWKEDEFVGGCLNHLGYPEDYLMRCMENNMGLTIQFTRTLAVLRTVYPKREFTFEEVQKYTHLYSAISALVDVSEAYDDVNREFLGLEQDYATWDEDTLFHPENISVSEAPKQREEKKPLTSIVKTETKDVKEEDYLAEIDELRRKLNQRDMEYKQLRNQYAALNSAKKESDNLVAKYKNDREELIALREFAYRLEQEVPEIPEAGLDEMKAAIADKTFVIVGGHVNWVNKLKTEFPKWSYVLPSAYKTVDASSLENKDMIFFFTDHISHVAYGKVIGIARERKIPFSYLHGVNMEQIIRQIYESGK